MPNDGAHNRPLVIFGGVTVKAFDAESPANGQASERYALQPNIDEIHVSIYFASAPSASDYIIEVADEDVEARYQQIAQSTDVNGEQFSLTTAANFIRAKKTSQTGGGAVTISFTPRRKSS